MARRTPPSSQRLGTAPAPPGPPSHGPLFDDAARRREAELLALVEASADDAAVAVYADWLEEQGDLPRATFLRTQQRLARLSISHPKLLERGRELHALGKTLSADWIAAVTQRGLAGTTWDGKDDDGTLVWRFLPTGLVNYTQPSGTFENGRWEQVGITVALETNAHYADYFGVIIGDTMRGNAHNIVGHEWRWKVRRTDDPGVQAIPDVVNRTVHDEHVRRPPGDRTPARDGAAAGRTANARAVKRGRTTATSTQRAPATTAQRPAKRPEVSRTRPRSRPLARSKPLVRRTPVRTRRR